MKPKRAAKINDQVPPAYRPKAHGQPPLTAPPPPRPAQGTQQRRLNYVTGFTTVPAAEAPPALIIRGGRGHIKLDLRVAGIHFHPDAFAFTIPDEALGALDIYRGDIVVIEPFPQSLREGDLVMMLLDGVETVCRLTYRNAVAYFHGGGTGDADPLLLPAWEYPMIGKARCVLRTFGHRTTTPLPGGQNAPSPGAFLPIPGSKSMEGAHNAAPSNRLRDEPGGVYGSGRQRA